MNGISAASLRGVPETLLIPLAARVLAPRLNADLQFDDPAARRVAAQLAFDPQRFASDAGTMRGAIVRGQWFDAIARRFIAAHPNGLGLNLGAGLDTRADRLEMPPTFDWVDVDLPEVAALRHQLLPKSRTISADVTDVPAWVEQIPWRPARPVLAMAEGVLMYLEPRKAEATVAAIARVAGDLSSPFELAFDFCSPAMVARSRRIRSLSKTDARFSWALRRPADLSKTVPGLELVEVYDIPRRSGVVPRVGSFLYKLMTGRWIYGGARYRLERPS